jgi:hypothetical protein
MSSTASLYLTGQDAFHYQVCGVRGQDVHADDSLVLGVGYLVVQVSL